MQLFEQKYKVSSLIVNSSGRLGLYSLLNILQDCAWEHAHKIGHGHSETLGRNTFWVLTRQKVKMQRWLRWGEELTVRTWVRNPQTGSVVRDFQLIAGRDELIGEATTGWLLLDAETRRPTKQEMSKLIDPAFVADQRVAIDPVKIVVESQDEQRFEDLTTFEVRNSDLDVNRHVNNTKYAQWILDAIPVEWHQRFLLHEYDINFLAETHLKDQVLIQKCPQSDSADKLKQSLFRGIRMSDQKIVFVAKTFSTDQEISS